MSTRRLLAVTCAVVALGLSAPGCKKKDKAKKDDTSEQKADAKEGGERPEGKSLDTLEGPDLSGPVPPETSAVFYVVDGSSSLQPVGCFIKDGNKLAAGGDCLKVGKEGDPVYLKSSTSAELDTLGGAKHPLCDVGATGSPAALSAPKVDAGQNFDFATWPKSLGTKVLEISPDTWSEDAHEIPESDVEALDKAIKAINSKITEKVEVHQAATLDFDGDGKDDMFFSAYVVDPRDTDKFLFSGLFVRRGSAPDKLALIEKDKTKQETFTLRAAPDLNGDGTHELWINAAFNEGGGDRIYKAEGDSFKALSKWTCGM